MSTPPELEMNAMDDKVVEKDAQESDLMRDESDDETSKPTRKQMKKQRKIENMQLHWKEKKEQKKRLKKEKTKVVEKKEDENGPSQEERLILKQKHMEEKQKWLDDLKTSPRVLIDLDFKSLMRDNEITSLVQQIMYSYGCIKRASKPLRLCLSSCNGVILSKLHNIQGFQNWLIEHSEANIEVLNQEDTAYQYPKDKIVYLSADAEETLEKLEEDTLYVIGGIVDRNRYKNLTLEKAKRHGYRCAKLPLDLVKFGGSRVLTVNNVVELLVLFNSNKDWKQAIEKGIPLRKQAHKEKEAEETQYTCLFIRCVLLTINYQRE